jgi:hypothetical protein
VVKRPGDCWGDIPFGDCVPKKSNLEAAKEKTMKDASQSKKEELICNKTNVLHPNDQNQYVEQPAKRQKVDLYDSYW